MIERYLRELGTRLESRGVTGRSRARVLAETEDHLRELAAEHGEEGAVSRFGESGALARDIAAQLATTRTIRSTYGAFAALVLTGLGYVGFVAFVDHLGRPDLFAGDHAALGLLAAMGLVLFPQLAFVSGGLALLRALRRRGHAVLSCEELDVMGRRSVVALGAGALTVASMILWAFEFRGLTPILALSAAIAVVLGLASWGLARATWPQAVSGGPPEDVFDDLRLERFRAHPWRFALLVAAGVALVGLAFGGPIQAAFEATALFVCFALLGRPLALRA
jgi:hypothetical protein